MQSESHSEAELQAEPTQSKMQEASLVCPKCKIEHDPDAIYCLSCGYPLYSLEQDEPGQTKPEETEDIRDVDYEPEAEPVIDSEMETERSSLERESQDVEVEVRPELGTTSNMIESVRTRAHDLVNKYTPFVHDARDEYSLLKEVEGETSKLAPEEITESVHSFDPDSVVKDVMRSLMKSISLNLWLVNLRHEGNIEEKQFNKLFEDYVNQSELFMNCRDEMLERSSGLESIEMALKEAKVWLEELEIKKILGDISEDEYRAKAPTFKWDIRKHEVEISKRKEEMAFLEDLTRVMSTEEITWMKDMAEKCQSAIDNLETSNNFSPETATRVKDLMEKTLAYLENFGLANSREKTAAVAAMAEEENKKQKKKKKKKKKEKENKEVY